MQNTSLLFVNEGYVMPVGNITLPTLHAVSGVKLGITAAHVRYADRNDLVIVDLCESATTVGVTTQNAFCAAPVLVTRTHLNTTQPRYFVINTGNANAGTGEQGMANALQTCADVAALTEVSANQVLPFSTGVIGEHLNITNIKKGLPNALANLSENNWEAAASGIMTTDTLPKGASEQVELDGVVYTVTGISKGAGMIRPNMATMLGFVATDAHISKPLLQDILHETVSQSFNRITVDGDTSTNDCCMLTATGKVGDEITSKKHPHFQALFTAIKNVMLRLAQLIVRDGEGATKFITVHVKGGKTTDECCQVAYAVAHSPLVKTAFFASDPNWGRILAAVGYAGLPGLDVSDISVSLGQVELCRGGLLESYTEEQGQAEMNKDEITITIDLARGGAQDTVYTCDFSYDYVKINADYRS